MCYRYDPTCTCAFLSAYFLAGASNSWEDCLIVITFQEHVRRISSIPLESGYYLSLIGPIILVEHCGDGPPRDGLAHGASPRHPGDTQQGTTIF